MKRQIFAQYAKRVFINSSSLKTHEKIHLEIKQFEDAFDIVHKSGSLFSLDILSLTWCVKAIHPAFHTATLVCCDQEYSSFRQGLGPKGK